MSLSDQGLCSSRFGCYLRMTRSLWHFFHYAKVKTCLNCTHKLLHTLWLVFSTHMPYLVFPPLLELVNVTELYLFLSVQKVSFLMVMSTWGQCPWAAWGDIIVDWHEKAESTGQSGSSKQLTNSSGGVLVCIETDPETDLFHSQPNMWEYCICQLTQEPD